ncbi:hypothetical protein M2J84_09225 [Comamonas aquatica]|uniref:hypothetical protein n=1 Tax=Comamonas aquatica TaxID=225991 RepID=UPI0022DE3294|nr:hypothetical protein [Comamonas aquatica]WBM44014.1 hypothetical protein M2J84_09225 [Comamonas aquatica]
MGTNIRRMQKTTARRGNPVQTGRRSELHGIHRCDHCATQGLRDNARLHAHHIRTGEKVAVDHTGRWLAHLASYCMFHLRPGPGF